MTQWPPVAKTQWLGQNREPEIQVSHVNISYTVILATTDASESAVAGIWSQKSELVSNLGIPNGTQAF